MAATPFAFGHLRSHDRRRQVGVIVVILGGLVGDADEGLFERQLHVLLDVQVLAPERKEWTPRV